MWKACNTVLGFETLEEPLLADIEDADIEDADIEDADLVADGLNCLDTQPERNTTKASNIAAFQAWKEETEIYEKKIDWVRRVEQFAKRYCEDDVRKCTYLLKEVNNWKKWLDLQREYKDIDYTQLIEKEDTTKPMETIACAGGKCDII